MSVDYDRFWFKIYKNGKAQEKIKFNKEQRNPPKTKFTVLCCIFYNFKLETIIIYTHWIN